MKTNQQRLEDMIRISQQGATIGVRFNDRGLNHLRMVDMWDDHSRRIDNSFFLFLREKQAGGYTSHPRGSRYDKILHVESIKLGIEYLSRAREEFPEYSFIFTESLGEDRTENMIAHSNITVI